MGVISITDTYIRIIRYINTCPYPAVLCIDDYELAACNHKFIKLTDIKATSLRELLPAESLRRIRYAAEKLRNVTVACKTTNPDYSLSVSWITDSSGKADALVGVLVSQDGLNSDEFFRRVSLITTCCEQSITPLQIILNNAAMLKKYSDDRTPEYIERIANDIAVNARRTIRDVSNARAAALMMSGGIPIKLKMIDVTSFINAAVDGVRPAASKKQIPIDVMCPTGHIHLLCDYRYMAKAILNILSNAVYFCDYHSHICVRVDDSQDSVSFTISDDGPGIPPDLRERIITGDILLGGKKPKTGLYIAHSIIKRHGGSLVFSDAKPTGTLVCATVPKRRPDVLMVEDNTTDAIAREIEKMAQIEMTILSVFDNFERLVPNDDK